MKRLFLILALLGLCLYGCNRVTNPSIDEEASTTRDVIGQLDVNSIATRTDIVDRTDIITRSDFLFKNSKNVAVEDIIFNVAAYATEGNVSANTELDINGKFKLTLTVGYHYVILFFLATTSGDSVIAQVCFSTADSFTNILPVLTTGDDIDMGLISISDTCANPGNDLSYIDFSGLPYGTNSPAIEAINDTVMGVGKTKEIEIKASDPNSDTITIIPTGLPSFASFDATTNKIIFTNSTSEGVYTITIMATDGMFVALESFTLTVRLDNDPPVISSTLPASDATGVVLNTTISAVFNEEIDSSTVNTSNVTLSVDGSSATIGIDVSYNNDEKKISFTPSGVMLLEIIKYRVTIKNITDLVGNIMADFSWTFTTGTGQDTTKPTIISTSPASSATSVAINSAITITFKEDMDSSTINTTNITLKVGTTPVSGTVSYASKVATFIPSANLSYYTTYTATISTGVKDLAGNSMEQASSFSFTTAPSNAPKLYVVDQSSGNIKVFDRASDGNATPLAIIGPQTLINYPQTLAVDTVNNEIYVTIALGAIGVANVRIAVYSRTASGNIKPTRYLYNTTDLTNVRGISVDTLNNEIAVATSSSINIYNRTDTGDVSPKRQKISGNLTGLNNATDVFIDNVNNEIFVANTSANTITVYNRTDTGNVAPKRTISSNNIMTSPTALSVDITNNEIAVSNCTANSVLIFSRTADGSSSPTRTIQGSSTGLDCPTALYIDATNSEIVVTNYNAGTITVYNRTDNGDVSPKRTKTSVTGTMDMVVDTTNNEILGLDWYNNSVPVYSRTAAGAAAVTRGIGSTWQYFIPGEIEFDTINNEMFVAGGNNNSRLKVFDLNTTNLVSNDDLSKRSITQGAVDTVEARISIDNINNEIVCGQPVWPWLTFYPRTVQGVSPSTSRTIDGSNTGIGTVQEVIIDTTNNEIIVSDGSNSTISVFSRTDSGNVSPKRKITGSSTTLSSSKGIYLANNEIFVANAGGNSILVFNRTDDGNLAPKRTISGLSTTLNSPSYIFVDTSANEIFVANTGNQTITVYKISDNGNKAPQRTISGSNTELLSISDLEILY
jgi:6-phosphogluconolactonase (cycloisomerase 2 family)